MQCPYCRAPLTETIKECPSCLLSLHTANSLLGPLPRTVRGLTDNLGVLEKGDGQKINRALTEIGRKFPQVNMHVLLSHFAPKFPIATHLFWLFNQGDFCASESKGGRNHDILLGIDAKHGTIGLIVGYGLEPFLPMKALDHTLEKAQPSLAGGQYAQAILTVIQGLDHLMEGVCSGFNDTLGIDLEEKVVTKEF
ncbi:TPM domain-containing protein [Verrucomicrobiaceae bacterium R5-34]|uniref:TPM domain-containing protein n=1 Tax=Oceaniferula flava TaxID=2800421 RepID=A0AAE2SAL8_9BACT|nr:TPM domain-containing protein [Oceaniferula flavus]MBK1830476.1 TPM domain-containing protein [Verrucomicrobiaceae bacterium R5-34]MBK1854570.1 TPM domain-containing protein [Oceaniferula flavus]MBM1135876.1 TPM domain-containing protein [Oceaniferula flavus]